MKHFSVLLSLIICSAGISHTGRISGGQEATSGQFPFMVALNHQFQYCNGVIIAPSWILTTSYCLFNAYPNAEVYIGSHINLVNGTAYRLFERITHKDYDDWTAQNDIGLIRINAVIEFGDTIQPIELGTSPVADSTCTIVGWDSTSTQNEVPLPYAETTILGLDLCQNISEENFDEHYLGSEQVCTLGSAGQGACYGDQGGALICDGKLSGVFSYSMGMQCGEGLPDVYTNIESYSEWILSYIGG